MTDIQQILNVLEKLVTGQKRLEEGQKNLEEGQRKLEEGQKGFETGQKNFTREVLHIKTVIKTLATKEDVEVAVNTAKAEIQADILNLGAKQTRKEHQQDTRIQNLEEHTGTSNPTKN
jgi:peptidoglycan hydrolase CwlO-like protein